MGKEQITKDRSVYAIIERTIDHGEFLSLAFPLLLLPFDRDRRNIGKPPTIASNLINRIEVSRVWQPTIGSLWFFQSSLEKGIILNWLVTIIPLP